MPVRGNQFKSANSFREEPKSKGPVKERVRRERTEILPKFTFSDGRPVKIIGLFFLIISLYFLVAFCSYLFTWQEDQSYVMDSNGGWSNLWKTQAELAELGFQQPVVRARVQPEKDRAQHPALAGGGRRAADRLFFPE